MQLFGPVPPPLRCVASVSYASGVVQTARARGQYEAMSIKLQAIPVVYFEEGAVIIAHCVSLDVSSCGHDLQEARRNISDAIAGFVATCEEMGTLDDVLEESGFVKRGDDWIPPALLSTDSVDIPVAV